MSNNICSILLGKRFEYDDPDFISYLEAMDENLKLLEGTLSLFICAYSNVFTFFPFTVYPKNCLFVGCLLNVPATC